MQKNEMAHKNGVKLLKIARLTSFLIQKAK